MTSKKIIISLWGTLGMYRGVQYYNYIYNSNLNVKNTYFYSKCALMTLTGLSIYLFPIVLPLTIGKELYRLEVNIYNLTDRKNSPKYYEFI